MNFINDKYLILLLTSLFSFNSINFAQKVADTKFSADRGFYDSPFEVEITTETENAIIRYTTDGSKPSKTASLIYKEPITVSSTTVLRAIAYKEAMEETDVDTHTYLFLDDVLKQSKNPAGFPDRWLKQNGSSKSADGYGYSLVPKELSVNLNPNSSVYWRSSKNFGGAPGFIEDITKVQKSQMKEIPNTFSLEQNYPNPFNPTTTIQFNLPVGGNERSQNTKYSNSSFLEYLSVLEI